MSRASDDIIKLSSNPVSTELCVEILSNLGTTNVVISNHLGQVVTKKSDVSTRSSLIDVSAFSAGIYSAVLYCGRSKTDVKFVKAD